MKDNYQEIFIKDQPSVRHWAGPKVSLLAEIFTRTRAYCSKKERINVNKCVYAYSYTSVFKREKLKCL